MYDIIIQGSCLTKNAQNIRIFGYCKHNYSHFWLCFLQKEESSGYLVVAFNTNVIQQTSRCTNYIKTKISVVLVILRMKDKFNLIFGAMGIT